MNTTSNPSVHRKVCAEKKNKNNYFSFHVEESKRTVWINQKIISDESEEQVNEHWRN